MLLLLLLLMFLDYLLKKDNLTKTTIDIGEERGGFYYLKGARELQSESDHVFQVARETWEISSKEEEKLWSEEKRIWISSQGEAPKFEFEERRDERPTRLFQQVYTRKNKDATIIPSLGFNTPINDSTMPLNDTSETNLEVHVSSLLTLDIGMLNPQVGGQGRRYPIRDRKEPNRRNEGSLKELYSGDGRALSGKEDSGI
ncbi:hypothetical protein CK203_018199 [Vitis vinifera]|uniref:Uncharacterized protein n=1 Tax=Vitis vinifera TaxID=29760 RepID=A0A438JP30_VITVI|nr:hypothetical protein CK203_018199 [Vitis vinifera]